MQVGDTYIIINSRSQAKNIIFFKILNINEADNLIKGIANSTAWKTKDIISIRSLKNFKQDAIPLTRIGQLLWS